MAGTSMAIDPSLLFLQGQQQASQGRSQVNVRENEQEKDSIYLATELDDGETKPLTSGTGIVQQQHEAVPIDARDDATLAAFLARMDEYEPILPDAVTRYYLERAGFQCSDDRV